MLTNFSNKTISPLSLRVFTKSFESTLLPLRLPLKNWEKSLGYGSYKLPFTFDDLRFITQRVEAKSLDFSFDREQRKYIISWDLGSKKHLRTSSTYFMNFKRYFSFGRIVYGRNTMVSFFKTLGSGSNLYAFARRLPRSSLLPSYSWYLDNLSLVLRKRFTFYRKLQTQSFDLDVMVSAKNTSLRTTFLPLLPTRYNSFFISSFSDNKTLRFTARYFRYFYKYNLRKNFWSHKLHLLWRSVDSSSRPLTTNNWLAALFMPSNLALFYQFKLFLKLVSSLFFLGNSLYYSSLMRFFLATLVYYVFQAVAFWPLLICFMSKDLFSYTTLINLSKKKDNLIFSNRWLQRKYIVVKLASNFNVIARHGFYRPWRNRFAFSLRNYSFLSVYPRLKKYAKLNISARKTFSKNVYKRDWFLYDSFHIAHRRARKTLGKFILLFITKQTNYTNIFSKLPFIMKNFFKFSYKFFKGTSSTYMDFVSKFVSSKQFFRSSSRSLDSTYAPLNLLFSKINSATDLLSQRLKNGKNVLLLSFMQKLTAKEIFLFLRSLRYFGDTSQKLTSKIKPYVSRWWKRYPLAKKISSNYLRLNNLSLAKKAYKQGAASMRALGRLMGWQFSRKQIVDELERLLKGLNTIKLLKPTLKKWVSKSAFKSRLIIGKFLRSQPLILNWFFNSLRFVSSNIININNHFTNYIASLKNFKLSSFRYWSRRWNARLARNVLAKTLGLKNIYHWDFNYFPLLGLHSTYPSLVKQRVFFLLNRSATVVNSKGLSFNYLPAKPLKSLPPRISNLLESFQRVQLILKDLAEQAKLAESATSLIPEDENLAKDQVDKSVKEI